MPITRTRVTLVSVAVLIVIAALLAGYLAIAMNWSYSTGERAGFLQKMSSKGWICKTFEGELLLVSMPGTMPEKFAFTVWNADIARQINAAMGKRVTLHYEQHKGLPGSCFGETEYFIVGVKEMSP
jgi:hypothetical protein